MDREEFVFASACRGRLCYDTKLGICPMFHDFFCDMFFYKTSIEDVCRFIAKHPSQLKIAQTVAEENGVDNWLDMLGILNEVE